MQIPWNTLHRRAHLAICRSGGNEALKFSAAPKSRKSDLSSGEKRKLSLICGLSLVVAILSIARAAHSAAAPAPSERIFIKSEFVSTPGFGKDPFFPKSTRHLPPVTTTTPTELAPQATTTLRLGGFSGTANRRLAIINNRTFAVGEEADMKVMGQIYHVKCVEIRDDAVLVTVNGQNQKLSLSPKL